MDKHFNPTVPQLKSHLHTTNHYIQIEIVRSNIQMLNNCISHPDFNSLIYQHKREFISAKDRQVNLLAALMKKIKDIEQTSFPFGGIDSNFPS